MAANASLAPLDSVVATLRQALGDQLVSVVLFGSAAEGTARPLSDLNVLIVLRSFDRTRVDGIREAIRAAEAGARLNAMFLLEDELPRAAEAFAVKFGDVLRRRRVVWGADPFSGLTIPRDAEVRRLRQVLLNLKLRLRWLYVVRSLREEQAAKLAVETSGPLRAAAASLYALEGSPIDSPRAALEKFVATEGRPEWSAALADLTRARAAEILPAGVAPTLVFRMIEMASALEARALRLTP